VFIHLKAVFPIYGNISLFGFYFKVFGEKKRFFLSCVYYAVFGGNTFDITGFYHYHINSREQWQKK